MRVLVIGGGGREHALAWKIRQSPLVSEVLCAPGNPGTALVAKNVPIAAEQTDELLRFALEQKIGLTVVGPEQPLVAGVTDLFRRRGLKIFGPSAAAAQLEGSKVFCKELMAKYEIPSGGFRVFADAAAAKDYARARGPQVVKAEGLAAGKGVAVCKDGREAVRAIEEIMERRAFGAAGARIVIEEFLSGREVSVLAFTDGETVLPLAAAQDHKTVFDDGQGPNTGGMGAYSPADFLTPSLQQEIMQRVLQPIVAAMRAEGNPYQGLLYAGLMLTAEGPRVLEFNARFGDPETQPLMMRLASDIVPLFLACSDGALAAQKLEWKPQAAACVVMASGGYPGDFEKGKVIHGLEDAAALPDVVVFHAGTRQDGERIVTHGGRVLGVTALGQTLPEAVAKSYDAVRRITWDGCHYRKDIGGKA